jgi:uncharacterized protein YgbK (DUF1537 family)
VCNTQSRTLAPAEAAARVRAALGSDAPGGGIVLKKIDTALRGALGAELDATMDAVGAHEAFVLPAIPEVGRTTEGGRQLIDGVPVHETAFARDPQNPIHDASVCGVLAATSRRAAAVLPLAAVRDAASIASTIEQLRAGGAAVIVCDARTDADLERTVHVLLARARPLVLAGSIGLARALRRALRSEPAATPPQKAAPAADLGGVLCVMGSAHPTGHGQVAHAVERGVLRTLEVAAASADAAGETAAGLVRDGQAVALVPPAARAPRSDGVLAAMRTAALAALGRGRPRGLVLVGGETAFHVLDGLGHPPLWLEARLAPLVVRARIGAGPFAGLALVTKGGSSGPPDLLATLVRQLGRGKGGLDGSR